MQHDKKTCTARWNDACIGDLGFRRLVSSQLFAKLSGSQLKAIRSLSFYFGAD
jgi:hypothetical protein